MFKLRGERRAIFERRLLGSQPARRLALHELPLADRQGRQPVEPAGERPQLGRDAEQRADEVLDVGSQFDQQLAVRLVIERFDALARRQQARRKPRVAGAEVIQEGPVDPRQAGVVVEDVCGQVKREMQHGAGHGGRA